MSRGRLGQVMPPRGVWQTQGGIHHKHDHFTHPNRSTGMDAVKKGDPVAKAVADVKRGVDRLIKLLGSKDDVVSVKAHSALCGLDLPPIGALADALF